MKDCPMAGHGGVIDARTNRGLSNVSFWTSSHSAGRTLKLNPGSLLNGPRRIWQVQNWFMRPRRTPRDKGCTIVCQKPKAVLGASYQISRDRGYNLTTASLLGYDSCSYDHLDSLFFSWLSPRTTSEILPHHERWVAKRGTVVLVSCIIEYLFLDGNHYDVPIWNCFLQDAVKAKTELLLGHC